VILSRVSEADPTTTVRGIAVQRRYAAQSHFPLKNGNCVLAIPIVFSDKHGRTLVTTVIASESIMLATFFVLWPFAAASLFALARFFDQRDRQFAKVQVVVRRHR
jgi:hypothetical protein